MAEDIKVKLDILNPKGENDEKAIIAKIDELIATLKTPKGSSDSKAVPKASKSDDKANKDQLKATKQINQETDKAQANLQDIAKGLGKSFSVMKAGIAAVASAYATMVTSSINALTRGAEKFISASSLRFDQQTADMMQMTGQTGAEAQATNRALSLLGLTFEQLQRGMLTPAQAEAFSNIRDEELAKLNAIGEAGKDVFGEIQAAQIELDQMVYTLKDSFLLMLVENKDLIDQVLASVQELIPVVMQVMDAVMPIFSGLLQLLGPILQVLTPILVMLGELVTILLPPLGVVLQLLMQVVMALLPVTQMLMDALGILLPPIVAIITTLIQGLLPVIDMVVQVFNQIVMSLMPIIQIILVLVNALLPPILTILQSLMPILEVVGILFEYLMVAIMPLLNIIMTILLPLLEYLNFWFKVFGAVLGFFMNILKPIIKAFQWLIEAINGFFERIFGWVKRLLGIDDNGSKESKNSNLNVPAGGQDAFAGANAPTGGTTNQTSTVNNNYNYGGQAEDPFYANVNNSSAVKLNVGGYGS